MIKDIRIPIAGITSQLHTSKIDQALSKLREIKMYQVNLSGKEAIIHIDDKLTSLQEVVKVIRNEGFDVLTTKKDFGVTGMSCASCAISVESMINTQPGVLSANVNFANNILGKALKERDNGGRRHKRFSGACPADVSIYGSGSDIVIDAAKITLISPDLRQIVRAFELSHLTVSTIKQNLFWALFTTSSAYPLQQGFYIR